MLNSRRVSVFGAAGFLAVLSLASPGCSRSPERARERYLESGKKLMEKKDYARAVLEFKNATQATPKDPSPHYQAALAYLAVGDIRLGIAELNKTLQLDPKHVAAGVKMAEIYAATRDRGLMEDATKRLLEVLSDHPDDPDILCALALAEWYLGKQNSADQHLTRAFEKYPKNLKSLVNLMNVKIMRNEPAAAEEALKIAAAQNPPSANVHALLGRFYLMTHRMDEAEAQLKRALELEPNNVTALLGLAALQVQSGRKQEAEQIYRRLSAQPAKELKFLYGLYLLGDGKIEEGLAELRRLYKEDPKDRDARSRLVWALLRASKSTEAEQILKAALEQNPKDTEALMQRSAIYVQAGREEEAQRDLAQILRLVPDSAEVRYLLAQCHRRRGATLLERQELTEAIKNNPYFLPARVDLAWNFTQAKAPKEALRVVSEAPQSQRDDLQLAVQLNWALLATGDLAGAQKSIHEALAKARLPELLRQDALLKMESKSYEEARKSAREALSKNPQEIGSLVILVRSYAAQKQMPEALKEVQRHTSEHPKSGALLLFLGKLQFETGNRGQARATLAKAKALEPKNTAIDLAMAQLDSEDGRLDEARTTLKGVVESNPGNATAQLWLGNVEEMKGNHEAAILQYRHVVSVWPDNATALNNLAYVLAEYGKQPDEALKYAEKAKELHPDNASVNDTLGWVYYRKALYTMAVRHLESAVAAEPTGRRKYHLAMAFMKAGDAKRGRQMLTDALKTDPSLPEAKEARQLLSQPM